MTSGNWIRRGLVSLAFEVASQRIPSCQGRSREVPNLISGSVGCCQMFRALALTPALAYRKACPEAREEPGQGSWLLSSHLFSFWVAGKMEKNAPSIPDG